MELYQTIDPLFYIVYYSHKHDQRILITSLL